ncbi:hypothetical protein [Burkholderia pseudomallei]|uniref:hypothetical protein n=1 Tax=Burkholderia pseudomallei TaxID=28450 RepID=UPI0000F291BF|nr:hypothetical protein [Burkholderia pseudomallei]ABN86506.1 hypothetical protein BURPS668_A3183 [Burkholderia pseudomallei 668]EDS81996.1 hypothetical protein BURPSS13_0170 [Burkholderia pseudomallei S13]MBO7779850.1 heterogeneous nuclear ribonucleoprotein R [Burkholderia pseudomallei]
MTTPGGARGCAPGMAGYAARPAPRDRHEGRAGLRAEPACGRGADIANANAIANVGVSLKPNTRASRSRTT